MNRYKLMKAGVNPNQGIERLGGKIKLYEKILNEFPEDDHFLKMQNAIETGNVDEAFACAHALKGITGNLSMTDLYEALQPLVEELRAGSMEHALEFMPLIEENYAKVIEAIGVKI